MKRTEIEAYEGKEIMVGTMDSWRDLDIAVVDSYGWSRPSRFTHGDPQEPINKGTGNFVAVQIIGTISRHDGRIVRRAPDGEVLEVIDPDEGSAEVPAAG